LDIIMRPYANKYKKFKEKVDLPAIFREGQIWLRKLIKYM